MKPGSQVEKTDPFRKGIVLAIAFGANIGGIGTPIGTPPNALAMGFLAEHGVYIDFFEWMVMAIPLVILIPILASLVLLWMYRPISKEINYQFPHKVELSQKGIHVIMITFFMLLLWLTSSWHGIPEALVALLGVGILTASQLVSSEDLKKIDWVIVGGESGRTPRPIKSEWVIDIQEQCSKNEVAFFFKQWGGKNKKKNGRELNGKIYDEMPEIELQQSV